MTTTSAPKAFLTVGSDPKPYQLQSREQLKLLTVEQLVQIVLCLQTENSYLKGEHIATSQQQPLPQQQQQQP